MYTVVLMMAMTGSGEATTFGGRRCHGCNGGCNGVVASSCHGGCHGGCHARRARCHGRCNGGGCHASVGCHGGCHGGCHVSYSNGNGYVTVQPRRINGAEEAEIGMAPATIIIELPAEARLTVDGQATTSTSGRRVFMSPPLAQGSEYFYTVNAEIMRNGQPVTVTRRVPVTAGRETRVTLDFDRQTDGAQPRQVTPARGEAAPAPQPSRDQNLERPKNNNNNQPNP